MLLRACGRFLDAVSSARALRFERGIERVQHVTGVQPDVVEARGFGGEPGVQDRHPRFVNRDRRKPASPACHASSS